MEEVAKLNRYSRKYHVEGFNESFQLIPYLKRLVEKDHIDVDRIIQKLPSEEIIKEDAAQLKRLMKRAHCYIGFMVPISYKIIESYIRGEDLSRYGERPIYIMKLNIIESPSAQGTKCALARGKGTKRFEDKALYTVKERTHSAKGGGHERRKSRGEQRM